jgi:hypothetical protein
MSSLAYASDPDPNEWGLFLFLLVPENAKKLDSRKFVTKVSYLYSTA